MSNTPSAHFAEINGERCYIGPERRIDRRRTNNNRRLESLLNNFGLDRRGRSDRRDQNTSWLIMSRAANL
ncbi:hypothetical protein [Pleionea sediminis]|uniref:hypothetical protein n=1 Tax=Pleionea sediminis TaxID=2569479 RepID=UPI001186A2BF|nr:hypothetical protein [Pleionea sediminis]